MYDALLKRMSQLADGYVYEKHPSVPGRLHFWTRNRPDVRYYSTAEEIIESTVFTARFTLNGEDIERMIYGNDTGDERSIEGQNWGVTKHQHAYHFTEGAAHFTREYLRNQDRRTAFKRALQERRVTVEGFPHTTEPDQ
jgi:hypothetical protein